MFQSILGKLVKRPAKLDKKLARELRALSQPDDPYETVTGKTMCTYDFYEGKLSIKNTESSEKNKARTNKIENSILCSLKEFTFHCTSLSHIPKPYHTDKCQS
jgi:hypothetical protein